MKKILFWSILSVLYSSNSFSAVRFDVENHASSDIVLEVRGSGSMVIKPGYKNWFSYENPNRLYEIGFTCKQVRNEFQCGVAREIQAIVYWPNCTINKGRLNNTIVCK